MDHFGEPAALCGPGRDYTTARANDPLCLCGFSDSNYGQVQRTWLISTWSFVASSNTAKGASGLHVSCQPNLELPARLKMM
jgi:hypothetical protein